MGRVERIHAVVALALSAVACAPFQGAPPRAVVSETGPAIPHQYEMAEVLRTMARLTDPDEKKELRNLTVALYLTAADFRFQRYRAALARDWSDRKMGLDDAISRRPGIGASAKAKRSEPLAFALAGAPGAISKNPIAETMLAALVAAMEAGRLRLRADIVRGLRQDDIDRYPLQQAFIDLRAYERAGSLPSAIEKISSTARQQAAIAEQDLLNAEEESGKGAPARSDCPASSEDGPGT